MRIGIQFNPRSSASLDAILGDFVKAEAEGFRSIWIGQVFDHDVLTLLALAGTRTSRIELGTSVVPLPPRHPTVLAQQALTTQLATQGRLCLGVGCGHPVILDRKLGLEPDHPLARTREALEVLKPLLRGEYVKYAGTYQRMRVGTPIAGAEAPSLILAALGPRMIELAGELTDGVTVVYVGAQYIAERVRPLLPPTARIVASLPISVTDRPEIVRPAIDEYIRPSTTLPVYQRVIRAQQVERVSELSLIGSVAEVEDGLARLAESGVTDLNPVILKVEGDPDSAPRTRALLAERARSAQA
jgi:F420-dependent oxidoreductase-like protein